MDKNITKTLQNLINYLSPVHVSMVRDSSIMTKWTCRCFSFARNFCVRTASAEANMIFTPSASLDDTHSSMSGLSSSNASSPSELASSIWSCIKPFNGQTTRIKPLDGSIDFTLTNTWNTRLFPNPVGSTANTPLP